MKTFLVLGSLLAGFAHGATHEVQSMSEVMPYVQPNSWVVFDLDNTLVEANQSLGTAQWFNYRLERFQKEESLSREAAMRKSLGLAERVHDATGARLVEATTPHWIHQLQMQGHPVLGLTARSRPMAEGSHRQLRSLGINLLLRNPFRSPVDLPQVGARYEQGILFVGAGDKGQVFTDFLDQTQNRPAHVVFVDDSSRHVGEMEKYLGKVGIPADLFRYGHLDEKAKHLDKSAADCEEKIFLRYDLLISDDQVAAWCE